MSSSWGDGRNVLRATGSLRSQSWEPHSRAASMVWPPSPASTPASHFRFKPGSHGLLAPMVPACALQAEERPPGLCGPAPAGGAAGVPQAQGQGPQARQDPCQHAAAGGPPLQGEAHQLSARHWCDAMSERGMCGTGGNARRFVAPGYNSENIKGIKVLSAVIQTGLSTHPRTPCPVQPELLTRYALRPRSTIRPCWAGSAGVYGGGQAGPHQLDFGADNEFGEAGTG